MSRCELLLRRLRVHALSRAPLGVLLLIACDGEARDTPPTPPPGRVVYEAGPNDLPDFRRYVVGDVPEPSTDSRDPFHDGSQAPKPQARTAPVRRAPQVHFQLHGIVERQGERVALLGRGSVRVGESVAGWTVREIGPREVLLVRGDRERRLNL